MKTFDIALKYLKDIDYKIGNILRFPDQPQNPEEDKLITDQITERHKRYNEDPENNFSNDYYRNVVFATAMYHLMAKAKGFISFFDVACEIIESDIHVVNTNFEKYKQTAYPKVMVDKWDVYCEDISDKQHSAFVEGELRLDLFFTAYHYLVGETVPETQNI
jgi:hypothetical protein